MEDNKLQRNEPSQESSDISAEEYYFDQLVAACKDHFDVEIDIQFSDENSKGYVEAQKRRFLQVISNVCTMIDDSAELSEKYGIVNYKIDQQIETIINSIFRLAFTPIQTSYIELYLNCYYSDTVPEYLKFQGLKKGTIVKKPFTTPLDLYNVITYISKKIASST